MSNTQDVADRLYDLYWLELRSLEEIGQILGVSLATVYRWMKDHNIPGRKFGNNAFRYQRVIHRVDPSVEKYVWLVRNKDESDSRKYLHEHRVIMEQEMGVRLDGDTVVHHKDENPLNNHPLNLVAIENRVHTNIHSNHIHYGHDLPSTCPWFYNHMMFAHMIGHNSHCERGNVGCVITNLNMDTVYAFGYNGGAKGMSNSCDSETPGNCGCLHAEINAMLKVRVSDNEKVMFSTHSPCLMCAKAIINAGFKYLYYGQTYRDVRPLRVLHCHGIRTCPYPMKMTEDSGIIRFEKTHYAGFVKENLRYEIVDNVLRLEPGNCLNLRPDQQTEPASV